VPEPSHRQSRKNFQQHFAIYKINVALISIALVAPCSSFGAELSAMEILHRTAASYHDLQSYQFSVTVDTVGGQKVSEQRLVEYGSGPGRYRIEDEDPKGTIKIGDGKLQWVTRRDSDQYTKSEITADNATPISDFENIDQNVTEATLAREELFVVDGKPVPVYVVMVTRNRWSAGAPPHTNFVAYRVDKQSFEVYKVITYAKGLTRIALYSISKWNQEVELALFTFVPPQSVHALSSMDPRSAPSTSIIGVEAPDFTLQDTSGHPIHLQDLRGKVVVVDFWATWCAPCRALMPHLQKMHQELSSKGLVILGLDIGEDADEVTKFMQKESYTFPALLGAEPDVSAKYYVEGYPTTFVIDRNGRIAFRAFSEDSSTELRKAVEVALR
jgi:thiol-disulfide isomerase/thioredoxin/outer membrane lipoprotein-sorting protein